MYFGVLEGKTSYYFKKKKSSCNNENVTLFLYMFLMHSYAKMKGSGNL